MIAFYEIRIWKLEQGRCQSWDRKKIIQNKSPNIGISEAFSKEENPRKLREANNNEE